MCLWQRRHGVLLESNTETELKGGSEMAFSITMINIFSLVQAFFLSSHGSVSLNPLNFLPLLKEERYGLDPVHLQDRSTAFQKKH